MDIKFEYNPSNLEEIKNVDYTEDSNFLYNQKDCEAINTSQFDIDEFEIKFIEDNGDK